MQCSEEPTTGPYPVQWTETSTIKSAQQPAAQNLTMSLQKRS
jgi:hypothetical protein